MFNANVVAGLLHKERPITPKERARRLAYMKEQAQVARRVKPTSQWLEDTIAVAQRRGLTPDRVSHYADGSVEIHFGEAHGKARKTPKGWDI